MGKVFNRGHRTTAGLFMLAPSPLLLSLRRLECCERWKGNPFQMSDTQTALGTVAMFGASEDTLAVMHALLTESGASQSLTYCPLSDIKRGITDFRKYLDQHNPEVVIFDISPPYHENWAFFTTVRDAAAMQGRGVVLTTTNKAQLDELAGEDSHAVEVVGAELDRALILVQIKVATLLARIARRQAAEGAP
jgi:hypothetical protein